MRRSIVQRIREDGLPLKVTSRLILAFSLFVTAVLIFATVKAIHSYRALENSTDVYITLEEQAYELMSASDYLTEQVQRYTVSGERRYLDNYFREAFQNRRREGAIDAIETHLPDSLALYELRDSMNRSVRLMNREYYAMVLVLDATGDTDIPEVLEQITLSEEDALLTPEQKLELAVSMVHDAEYYFQKGEIRRNLNECLAALKGSTYNSQESLADAARRAFVIVIILIVIQSLNIIAVLWLYNNLGISPLIKAAEHIGENESVPVAGAREFRYMAGAYNAMYETYRNSIANLNYKASHDKLTGVYNRAGYDFIKNNVDMTTTALMMVDGDKFKEINDNYGHDVGDLVLKKIADTLRKYFRSDDYVCRVGGDEFVVLMVHIPESPRVLIETKIDMINNDLQITDDGVPSISLSIGIAYDPEGQEPDEMFRRADAALYHVKQNGRSGCCFYSDIT